MECSLSGAKGPLKEGSFSSKLINILETTKYEGVNVYTGSTKRLNDLNAYQSFKKMSSFIEWFSLCITKDNCLTSDEFQIYKNLRIHENLVPEEDLDHEISTFCEGHAPYLFLDYKTHFDVARKELEALESADKLLSKMEKSAEKKKKAPALDVETIIRGELEEFEKLNKNMNKALENHATAWEELRKYFSQNRMEAKKISEESIIKINKLINCIDKNLNYHLKNDFKEVKPTDGKIETSIVEIGIILNKFIQVKDEIINIVATTEGLLSFKKKLMKSKQESFSSVSSLNEIRDILHEENNLNKLRGVVTDCLQEEVNSVSSLQLLDRKGSSTVLADRLDRLSKLEDILKQKKAYSYALHFIVQRSKVVQDFQFEKLNELLKQIQLDISTFQQRMDMLCAYKPKKAEGIDSNFKAMMNFLNVKHPNLHALDEGIAALHENIKKIDALINSTFLSLEESVVKRFMSIETRNNTLIDGPTREAFSQIFDEFMAPMETALKTQGILKNKISKIRLNFTEIEMNTLKNDCLWMKCLNNPVEFVNSVFQIEEQLSAIKEENEILMQAKKKS